MKKVLIVGAGFLQAFVIKHAKELGYEVYDATAVFSMTTISADISWDGFIKTLYVEVPFELHMSICDINGYHFVDAVEKGTITEVYHFEY